jgi:hypothetical protein
VNSDLAFKGNLVYQGNFAGFSIWDVSNPAKPEMLSAVECITSQGDPSIVGNLLFVSAEGGGNRKDCGKGGVENPADHMAGVRIYDVSNPRAPRLVKNVETCKGSHTHTVVPHPKDKGIVYLYVSGSQGARPETELAGCKNGADPADTTNSLYRLDVIKVPLARPQDAAVVTGARIFSDLGPAPTRAGQARRARALTGADSAMMAQMAAAGPRNCHDVTAYPEMGLLAGACASHGLLVDISNPEKPKRIAAAADTNFSLWHTAVFSNDGKKIVFTDEWGGGTSPNCQKQHPLEMGGNTTLSIGPDKKLKQHAYFKIPSSQSAQENCVSHNGSLVPIPGRDVMVQGLVPGRHRRDRLHGRRQAGRDRVLRPRARRPAAPHRPGPAGPGRAAPAQHDRRLVGRLLVQRARLLVGDGARPRHPRADAERSAVGQRDRGGQAGADGRVQPAEPAEDRCGRRRSRSCARTWTSWCATRGWPQRARRRSRARSTRPRSRAAPRVARR